MRIFFEVHVTDDIIFSNKLWHDGTLAAFFSFAFIDNDFSAMLRKWLMRSLGKRTEDQ